MTSLNLRRGMAVATTAVLALMLLGPATVTAATPNLIPTWTVIPTTVQDGDYVAFRASIYNNDTSTVSQLYLVEIARDANLTLVPDTVSTNQGTCATSGATFSCNLGQLKPRKTATVTAVFQTAVLDPAAAYTATGSWEFNTTGLGSGGGDNSHGDSWPSGSSLTANVTPSGDFGGRYVLNGNLKIVENNQALSNSNPHSTRAYSPATGIGVTVEDIDCTVTNPDALCSGFLATGFGQISKVNVNDDHDVSGTTGTTLLHFYVQLDASEIVSGAKANNVFVLHSYPTGQETITTRCAFPKKGDTTVPTNAPCIVVRSLPGGDLGVDIYSFHNGGNRLTF